MALNILIGTVVAPRDASDPECDGRLEPMVNVTLEDDVVDSLGGVQAVIGAVFNGLGMAGVITRRRDEPAEQEPAAGLSEAELAELLAKAGEAP